MTDHDATRPVGVISRRRLLQGSALAGFGAFVAACRPAGGASPTPSAAASAALSAAPRLRPRGSVGVGRAVGAS